MASNMGQSTKSINGNNFPVNENNFPANWPKKPLEQVKLQILQDRLQLSPAETFAWVERLKAEIASEIELFSSEALTFDVEFHGREIYLLFTFDRQNLPPVRRRP